jgi:hypothetical protein
VIGEQQRPEPVPGTFRIGPADHHELFAVQAFNLEPQAAIAGRVARVGPLRDNPFQLQGARMLVETPATPGLIVAVFKRRKRPRQQRAKTLLPYFKRLRADGFAVEMEQVEQEKDERLAVARVRRGLDQAERGRAVGANAAELAIKIGLPGGDRRKSRGNRRIFMGPDRCGSGAGPHPGPAGRASGSRHI